ncbi:hypothetical protein GCM10010994_34060 [Chelatococcus reniformis]|uniref:Uncharacterized protein n=1 Tax=Chelatococcus reniformis TaxID=1494448 RepID=A0A916XHV4_9HYPH|nr:hypothetical protein GCM10010994_34060 [Chelatococcus reniformis]
MQLGAPHDDAVLAALDDADVEIGIVLLVGAALAVALGVGDHLGPAQIVVAAILVHTLDVLGVHRVDLGYRVLDLHQGHEHAGDGRADRGVLQQLDALVQVFGRARHLVDPVRLAAVLGGVAAQVTQIRVVVFVVVGNQGQRHLEAGILGDVRDVLAIPIGDAAVPQRFDILLRCLQTHRILP